MVDFSIEVKECTLTRVEVGRGDGTTYWNAYPHTRAYLGERSLYIVCMATGAPVASVPRSWIVSFMRCPVPASQAQGCRHPHCKLGARPMILPRSHHMIGRADRSHDAAVTALAQSRKRSPRWGWFSKVNSNLNRLIRAGKVKA